MNIKNIIENEGIKLNSDGAYLVGISPFSDSRLPLLVVDEEKQTFSDLSTGICGDAVSFIENLKGVSRETAERMVRNEKPEQTEDEEARILKNIMKDTNEYFKSKLTTSDTAKAYLNKRGFDEEDIKRYEFGYAPKFGSSLFKHLQKTYEKEMIIKSGVCKVDKEGKTVDLFWNRLMIPIRDTDGDIVAFGGRVLGDGTPKYINSPESPIFHKREMLYGYHIAKNVKCNAYIICEGYMDVLSLHKAGLTNAVASLGTALSKTQCELLTNKKRVYVLYDTDAAGVNASKKAIPMLEKLGLGTRVIDYSPAKDPDEFLKEFGLGEFRERFEDAEKGERYVVKKLIEEDIDKAVKYMSFMSINKIVGLMTRKENICIK